MKKPRIDPGNAFANTLTFLALVIIGFGLYLGYAFFIRIESSNPTFWTDYNTLGVVGEFLGGTVGSIWALAGVILFFLALIYQKRELALQRIELHENRKIMQSQSRTIAIQQFENTFFQLLNFHINAANQIRMTNLTKARKSVNAFDSLYIDFKKETVSLKKRKKADVGAANLADDSSLEQCFAIIYEGYKNTFQHYLENYKTLLLFINSKSLDPTFYYNILKSHFTEQEVLIHFYYVMLGTKNPELKRIVEEYHLFQKLNQRAVEEVDPYHLQKLNESAYLSEF